MNAAIPWVYGLPAAVSAARSVVGTLTFFAPSNVCASDGRTPVSCALALGALATSAAALPAASFRKLRRSTEFSSDLSMVISPPWISPFRTHTFDAIRPASQMLLAMDARQFPASAYVNNTRIVQCKYRGPLGRSEFRPGGKITGKLADSH